MRSTPHPLDTQLCRLDATYNPLLDFYFSRSHGVQHDLAVDIEVYANYIALDLAIQMNLKLEPHPDPHRLDDDELILYRCKLLFSVGSYKDEVWCDVVHLQNHCVLLGRGWLTERHVRYSR